MNHNVSHELFGCYGNVWIRQKKFLKVGEKIRGHKHNYDHVSLLASGKVRVEVDDNVREFEGPTFLVISKDKMHTVTALTDDVLWYCIFANRDVNGEVFDPEASDPSYVNHAAHDIDPNCPSLIGRRRHTDKFTLNEDGSVQDND